MLKTRFCERFGIEAPIIGAPMVLRETVNGAERLIRELAAKVHENGWTPPPHRIALHRRGQAEIQSR